MSSQQQSQSQTQNQSLQQTPQTQQLKQQKEIKNKSEIRKNPSQSMQQTSKQSINSSQIQNNPQLLSNMEGMKNKISKSKSNITTQSSNNNNNNSNNNNNNNKISNINNPSINTSTNSSSNREDQKDVKEENVDLSESKSNLIINYIPPSMNEGQLASLFSPYGTMENIKIVNDLNTGRSRGYGFIKYKNEDSALRALKALNGYQAGSKRLKVAYARPKCKEIQNANLYITNIPLNWSEKNIRPLFVEFGKIIECRILKDEEGKSRGVGFVRMDTHMNAIKAMEGRDRYKPDGNEPALVVKLAQRRTNRNRWQNRNRQNKNSTKTMDPMVQQNTGFMAYNRNTNNRSPQRGKQYYRPRNQYSTSQTRQFRHKPQQHTAGFYPMFDAFNAIGTNNPTQATTQQQNTSGTQQTSGGSRNFSNATFNIIVYNIPQSYNVDHLIQLYAPYGPIQSVNIQKANPNQKGPQGQGYGIISYFYFDDAQRAQSQTNGKRVGDRRLDVVFQNKA